jgi:uncharacterized protein YaiE (UPF0345 family)
MALTKVKSEQLDAAQTSITSVGTLTGLTVSGALTVDTSTLVVDATNNMVGIGNSSPSSQNTVFKEVIGSTSDANTGSVLVSSSSGSGWLGWNNANNATIPAYIKYEHSNDSMLFQAASAERMRITSGGVGIGTSSSPSFAAGGGLQVQADTFSSVRVTETGNTGLDVSQASDAKGYIYLRDNADLIFGTNNTERMRILASGNVGVDRGQKIQWYDGTIGSGNINAAIEGTGDPALKLFTRQSGTSTLTERMRIDANGHLILKKNLVLESTSEGIDFSGVGSSAETLDDYEEGTWTGRLASSTSGGTNYDSAGATGRYIKIGRLVHIQIHYTQSISGSGGGAVYMIGLPYAAQNYNSMTHWVYGGFDNLPANFSPILRTQIGQSAIIFQAQKGGASSIDISPSNFGGGVNIMVSGTYVTAS